MELLLEPFYSWIALGVTLAILIALVRGVRLDVTLSLALVAFVVVGMLSPEDAFAGFSSNAVLTVGSLFIVAAGIKNTGAFSAIDRLLFPQVLRFPSFVLLRLMLVAGTISAFINNTPTVAILMPRIQAWSYKHGIPVSKLLLPLSYAALLGGVTTLIGTSSNLIVLGLVQAAGYGTLGLFDLAYVGVPALIAVVVYFLLIGYRLLPTYQQENIIGDSYLHDYLSEIRISPESPLVGQTIQEVNLPPLQEERVILWHIYRQGQFLPVSPQATLEGRDILTFTGDTDTVEALLQCEGVERVVSKIGHRRFTISPLYEAVIAPTSDLVGRTLRDVNFRESYHGVVLGIHRQDMLLQGPLGHISLEAGDLLLIEARDGFDRRWRAKRDEFYIVAPRRPEQTVLQARRAPLALGIFLLVILLAAFNIAPIVLTSFAGALAMILAGCIQQSDVQRSVDLSLLLIIAAALGIGKAIEGTGLPETIAQSIVSFSSPLGTLGALVAVYIVTSLLTELITNNAAAAMMVPIGLAAAQEVGIDPSALAITIAAASSSSFMTPIGYHTNLMVMDPGGYKFTDFVRAGLFVKIIAGFITLLTLWLFWL